MTICVTMLYHRYVMSYYCCYRCYMSFVTKMMTTTKMTMSYGKSLSSTMISMLKMTTSYYAPFPTMTSCCYVPR